MSLKNWVSAVVMSVIMGGAALADVTIIHGGLILDKPGQAPKEDHSVIIEDGRVSAVEAGFVKRDGAKIIDLKDHFVMPGLMDMHVHIQGERGADEYANRLRLSAEDWGMRSLMFARRTLEAGFTTIRDLGPRYPQQLYAMSRAIDKGWIMGPRIIAAAGVNVTGSHGDVDGMRHDLLDIYSPKTLCDGPYECRKAVRQAVKYGAGVIKITATGGVLSDTDTGTGLQMRMDEMKEIVDTAHSLGRRVAAHAHAAAGINAALEAGVDSIEHGSYANKDTFRLMKKSGAYFVPTLLAGATVVDMANAGHFKSEDIKAKALQIGADMASHFAAAVKAGVNVAYGTDSGVSRHGDNAREAQLMEEAGMTPMQVIEAATVNAADLIDMSEELGTLETGKHADIIALKENPLDNIVALTRVSFVMKGGTIIKKD